MARPKGSKNKNKNNNLLENNLEDIEIELKEIDTNIQDRQKEELKNLIEEPLPEELPKQRKKRITKEEKLKLQQEELNKKREEFVRDFKGFGSMLLAMAIKRMPNPLPLEPEEAESFDKLFSRVVFKYSDKLGNYQDEVGLAIITLMIITPRLKKIESFDNEEDKTN